MYPRSHRSRGFASPHRLFGICLSAKTASGEESRMSTPALSVPSYVKIVHRTSRYTAHYLGNAAGSAGSRTPRTSRGVLIAYYGLLCIGLGGGPMVACAGGLTTSLQRRHRHRHRHRDMFHDVVESIGRCQLQGNKLTIPAGGFNAASGMSGTEGGVADMSPLAKGETKKARKK